MFSRDRDDTIRKVLSSISDKIVSGNKHGDIHNDAGDVIGFWRK